MIHLIRASIAVPCTVCGMPAYSPCIKREPTIKGKVAPPIVPVQSELDLEVNATEVACLEYQIMAAARRLKELKPKHYLVVVLTAVLKHRAAKEKPQQ